MRFTVIFEECLVILVRSEGNCCVILANLINCRVISDAVSLEMYVCIILLLNEITI